MNRIWLAAGSALVVVGAAAAAATTDAQAKRRRGGDLNEDLVVTLVTPTTNQEVLPDLSDPGLNNVVTVRFSAPLRPGDFISNNNVFNRLAPAVEFLDSAFNRLPGTPIVTRNVFRFDPRTPANLGVLANGQYTLHIKSSARSRAGKLLNQGVRDWTTTFTVGTDIHAPVLRKISPINGQRNIGLNQRVIVSFNEPIDAASLLTTVSVNDVGTNPPTPILGPNFGTGVTTERNGFDVVFTPDPCFGYPPKTTIEFKMQGRPIPDPTLPATNPCNNPPAVAAVTDVFGNQFSRDAGLHWVKNPATGFWDSPNGTYEDCTGSFRCQFETRGTTPAPVGFVPGSSQWVRYNPCGLYNTVWSNRCDGVSYGFFYTTGTGLGEIDFFPVIAHFSNTSQMDFKRSTIIPNSPVRMGRPVGMMVDPRWDALTLDTYLYVVDQRSASVLVVNARDLKVLGRLSGFSSPADVAIASDFSGGQGGPTRVSMFVSDFGAQQVTAIDLSTITVSFSGQPGAATPCDSIKDNTKFRTTIAAGRGPAQIAADSYLNRRAMVVNSLDNSVTLINARERKFIKDYDVGGNPLSVDWTLWGFGGIDVAAITNQGGLTDQFGSVSMYLRAPPLQGGLPPAAQTRDGIESTLTDGIKNPTHVWAMQEWANPATGNSSPQAFFVANTGGKTVLDLRVLIQGGFGLLISFQANQEREVGFNPTKAMLDPYYPCQFLFACVAGEAQFVGMDFLRQIPGEGITVPGMRNIFTVYQH